MSNYTPITPAATVLGLGARSELLGTPINGVAGTKPLNPFADDHAVVSNNMLSRRPGSSPQPNLNNGQPDILRRPAATVDAVIKTTSTTAPGAIGPPVKSSEPKVNWCAKLSRKHPIKLLNYTRLYALLPLLAYLTFESLSGSDWRHNEYRFDDNGSSRTLLSLSGVERVVRTGLENRDNAAMLSELAVSYKSAVLSSQCDFDSHIEKASLLIGQDRPLDVARVNSDRNYRLAVFGILYGPTYRDVDCRALQKFRVIGVVMKIFLYLAIFMILFEWLICLAHFSSDLLMEEAIRAYEFLSQSCQSGRKAINGELDDSSQQAPPFLFPVTDEWDPIDMVGGGGGSSELRMEAEGPVLELPSEVAGSHSPVINKFWWTPLLALLRKCGLYSTDARHQDPVPPSIRFCPSEPVRVLKVEGALKWLPLLSFLEGSTLVLSMLVCLMLSTSLFVWSHQTNQPACLNAETELETCQKGSTYSIALAGAAFAAVSVLSHIYSGSIINRVDHAPKLEHKWY